MFDVIGLQTDAKIIDCPSPIDKLGLKNCAQSALKFIRRVKGPDQAPLKQGREK